MHSTTATTSPRPGRGRLFTALFGLYCLTRIAPAAAETAAVVTFPDVRVTVPSVPLVDEEMGAASVAERDFLHTLSRYPVPADQLELTEGEPIPTGLVPLSPGLSSTIESISMTEDASLNGYYFIPADPHGAVGPGHVVSVVNSSVRWHTTGGTLQGNMRLGLNSGSSIVGSFFEPLTPANSLFDPKVIYDTHDDRFLVVALEKRDSPQSSRILVAASDDSDPNGTWYYLAIDSKVTVSGTDYWADYPSLGVDEEAFYITNNMFTWAGSGIGCRLWIIDKAALYAGSPTPAVRYDPYGSLGISGLNTTSMVAQVYGTPPAGAAGTWLVSYSGLSDGTNEYVGVLRVDNPLGSPTFAYAQVNCGNIDNTSVPLPDAPQPGTAQTLETNDQRALNAVWRSNGLYLCAQVTPPSGTDAGQSTAHWWQLSTAVIGTPTLTDQGNIGGEDIGTATHTSFPSIAVSAAGDVAVGFSAAGATVYPGAYYAARAASDPAGTMQSAVTVAAGTDYYYRAFGGPRNRWGDYSATVIDPAGTTFWVFNKYAVSRGTVIGAYPTEDGRWGTRWGSFTMSAPSPLTATLTAPNGGETWAFGSSHAITWTASGGTGTITADIDWSANNGGSWTSVATGLANSGTYNWTVPSTATAQALVRVTAHDAAAGSATDGSNAVFALTDQTGPSVSVSAPAGGATLTSGVSTTISWSASDNVAVSSVNIDHSTNNGGSWTSVATGLANTGSTSWTPTVATTQGRIRVTAFDAAGNNQSAQSGTYTVVNPDVTAPVVTANSPNGGENLAMGSSVSITWAATDNIAVTSVALGYSTNGGASFTTIATGLANSGSYSWTVPALATTQGRIRVTASDAAGLTGQDDSNANFSIVDATLPVVSVTAPSTGNSWVVGTVHAITWSATDNLAVTSVAVDYSTDNGGGWTVVATGEANDGSYSWTVPNAPTSQGRVRVRASDAAGNVGSGQSAQFTIVTASDVTPPTASLTAPNGGESLAMGASASITWTASDDTGVTSVTLAFSSDGGSSYATIASGLANGGSYAWTVPATATSLGRIRVTASDAAGHSANDASDANFAILDQTAPVVALIQPATGSSWQASTTHGITWSASDNVGVTGITLEYSTNNGGSWTTITTGLPNSGSHDWVVPDAPTAQARVRATAADVAGNTASATGGAFTITAPPDGTPPTVAVTAPNGGEAWSLGSVRTVTWTASDNQGVTAVTIAWSSNGGGSWSTLATNEANDGSWNWTTPSTPTTQARIRVTARDAVNNTASDDSDANFSLVDATPPTVTVLSPGAGNIWTAGTVRSISWSAGDNVGITSVTLESSTDNGGSWVTIASGESNDGSYSWSVPDSPTTQGRVRVTAVDAAGNSGSGQSGLFTINAAPDQTPPSITLIGPNGGENLAMGTVISVGWSATDNVGVTAIGIDFSSNGGASWLPVVSGEPNDGAWDWTVPNVATTQALLRVTGRDAAGNSALDLSNSGFAITDQSAPDLVLTSPSGPVSWAANSLHTVTWTASDNVAVVALELDWSSDGGAGWNPVTAGEANDGSYGWTLPDANTDDGRLRLTALDAAGNRTEVVSDAIEVKPIVPIVLASFLAVREGAEVAVRWEAQGEGSRSLFHVHRAEGAGARVRLTERPLTGQRFYEWRDTTAPSGSSDYWLLEIEASGAQHWYGPATAASAPPVPVVTTLAPAAPNPFRDATTFAVSLASETRARLLIHDIQGRFVVQLLDGAVGAGGRQFEWDGTDAAGRPVAPGIYFFTLETSGQSWTRKVVRVR